MFYGYLRLAFIGTKGWIVALNAPDMNLVLDRLRQRDRQRIRPARNGYF